MPILGFHVPSAQSELNWQLRSLVAERVEPAKLLASVAVASYKRA